MRTNTILKAYAQLQPEYKAKFEKQLKGLIKESNDSIYTLPSTCPKCGSIHPRFIKRGRVTHVMPNGKKRYGKQILQCKDCKKKLTWDSGTITSFLKISNSDFYKICVDTLNLVPIERTAAELDKSNQCIFENRHKFLVLLQEFLVRENIKAEGTVEFDEKYILESEKGNRNLCRRKARRRGEPSKFRGISHEQVCIVTTTDRIEHEIFKVVGFGAPTKDIISEKFKNNIGKQSIIYVDGKTAYDKLADETQCKIVHLKTKSSYNKVEHINTINSIHSMIASIIQMYRGVSTEYMQRYMGLFVLLRRLRGTDSEEKKDYILKHLRMFHYRVTRESLKLQHIVII